MSIAMVQGIFLIHFIVICSCLKYVLTVKECKKIDECSCSTDEGEISLWKLAETGKPRFSNIFSNVGAYKFSWNPCNSFSLSQSGGECIDVAACLENTGAHYYYGIAKQTTATCALDHNGECALHYTGKGILRAPTHFVVTLRCNESQEGKVDPVNFQITTQISTTVLHSKYACVVTPLPSGRLSLGSILVISFSCILIVYIVCGILINIYIRHVEGKKAFPNYSFWADFPYLIKDGCVFTYQSLAKLCGLGPGRTGYATI